MIKAIKIQIFENDKRTTKAVFKGQNIKECIEKMINELKIKGWI